MGRPKEHDDATAQALLAAAEEIAARDGVDAVSVRRVASEVGTTTRAVYSLFGSKDGLIAALGAHAFDLLGAAVGGLAETKDPARDLVDAGVAFRRFATSHPSLFRIAVQRAAVPPQLVDRLRPAAQRAMATLERRIARLDDLGRLGGRSVPDTAWQFHALCEGLAALELRGVMPAGQPEKAWRSALAALVAGFATAPSGSRRG